MGNYIKEILLITFLLTSIVPSPVVAQVWELALFYDGEILRADREVQPPQNLISGKTAAPSRIIDSKYSIRVLSEGTEMYQQQIRPQRGPQTVEVPYMAMADTIEIRTGDIRTTVIDISESRACFPNGVCEFERGENELTCPSDCFNRSGTQYSAETQALLQRENGVIRDQEGTVLLDVREEPTESSERRFDSDSSSPGTGPLILGVFLVFGAGGYWIYRKVKKS